MDAKLEHALKVVTEAAIAGRRCPENGTEGMRMGDIALLARMGKIRIEIYALNYRRVVILEGEHANKATAPHPTGKKPWKVLDGAGTRMRHRAVAPSRQKGAEPWRPGRPIPQLSE